MSWRFKALDDAFPFVMITHPSDHRLLRDALPRSTATVDVRAIVLGPHPIGAVRVSCDGSTPVDMQCTDDPQIWGAQLPVPNETLFDLVVEAVDATGRPGGHAIRAATDRFQTPTRRAEGSDAASIGAWPENGIFGTQLGPNRNAKPSPPPPKRS